MIENQYSLEGLLGSINVGFFANRAVRLLSSLARGSWTNEHDELSKTLIVMFKRAHNWSPSLSKGDEPDRLLQSPEELGILQETVRCYSSEDKVEMEQLITTLESDAQLLRPGSPAEKRKEAAVRLTGFFKAMSENAIGLDRSLSPYPKSDI